MHENFFFVVDTHPIGQELGRNGNGMVVIT